MRNPHRRVSSRPLASARRQRLGIAVTLIVFGLSTAAIGQAAGTAAGESIAKLRAALKSPDGKARIQAIDALGRMGPEAKEAVKDLVVQLSDQSPAVRSHAAHALRSIGPAASAAAEALAKLVGDGDAHVRRTAIEALERVHPDAKVAVPALAKALEDADPAVRVAALAALTDYNEAAVDALSHALENEKTRYWAALALGQLGTHAKPAVAALSAALNDKRAPVRREVLITLAHIGPDAASAVPAITPCLDDADASVRNGAAYALGRIGPAGASAIEALREASKKSDPMLTTICAWALARIEPENKGAREKAVELLSVALKDKDAHVRSAALRGLLELETPPVTMVPLLAAVLPEADEQFLHEAMAAFASWGEAATPALVELLKRPGARGRAALLIGRLGVKAAGAVPALTAALADKDAEVRSEVLFALAAMGPDAAAAQGAILKLLDDPEPRVRAIAAYSLGRIGENAKVAIPQLKKELQSSDAVLRVSSARRWCTSPQRTNKSWPRSCPC